jgi:putative peptide zinc metalloprotease protein
VNADDRPLHSPLWHRVAALRPRWRIHARADPQSVRGATWHVVVGDGRTDALRLDAAAWAIAGRCDGERTVAALWDEALAADPEGAPTQDEAIALIARLVDARVLECDGLPDVDVLLDDDRRRAARALRGRLNPLAPRLRLGDPSALLRPLAPFGRCAFSPLGAGVWVALLAAAALIALTEWEAIARHAAHWMDTPRYLLLAWLVWVPMKAVHELAHGLSVRRWGGEVHEAGIGLMLLWPAPYVDASAAHRFAHAGHRALVGAAGIVAETGLAAAALLVWAGTGPGWVNDTAFVVAVVGTVSTLLFNGNPLLRMDAYFVLCDAFGLPNLASRSGQWWHARWQRRVLGLRDARGPDPAPGERGWLEAYAPLSWLWRVSLLAALAVWAGAVHRGLGAAVVLAALLWLVGLPLWRLVRAPSESGQPLATRAAARMRLVAAGGGLLALVLLLPLPDRVIAPALVWAPDEARVRAGVDGFVVSVAAEDAVARGAPVVRLDDPALRRERERLLQAQPGLSAELFAHLRTDPARARQAEEALARARAELAEVDARLARLEVGAPVAGRFAVDRPQDLPGRFVREGDALGWVLDDGPPVLRVALGQDDAARLRDRVHAVDVRLAELPGTVLRGRLLRESPAALERLPGAALGEPAGGPVPIDPEDRDGLKPARPTYVIDVRIDDPLVSAPRLGGRAWVRLDLGQASAAAQAARWVRQTVRGRFAPDAW